MRTEMLFVYGTLRSECRDPRHEAWFRGCRLIGVAHIEGALHAADGFPAAVASQGSSDRVAGDLYEVADPEFLFGLLDAYEGVPTLFRRRRRKVHLPGRRQSLKAWVYLYNRPVELLRRIQSGDYLEFC